ncbi:type IV secretory system conjugative DNA transfer family protein [Pseudomonas fragi]|nr:type IV secretory system conjugative DNA transfer family protein [Pseudomonas fragi]
MANEVKIITTSDGTEIPVIMAPPGHGAGVGFVIPKLLSWPNSADVTDVMAEPRKRGYAKPAIS